MERQIKTLSSTGLLYLLLIKRGLGLQCVFICATQRGGGGDGVVVGGQRGKIPHNTEENDKAVMLLAALLESMLVCVRV